MKFTVDHKHIRLQVVVLPSVADVDARYRKGRRRRDGQDIHAFFLPTNACRALHHGKVVLPADGNLDELVPHEVTHAVIHCLRGVSASDDEFAATAVGMLCAQIFKRIRSR
jgi:hypothetical protein